MKKRELGHTGIEIPEIGLGCWPLGGAGYGPVSEASARETLEKAWELGVRFFDTADCYGDGASEERLGNFLKGKPRDDFFIATKGGWDFYHGGHKKNFDPSYIQFACEESLKRLEVQQIDLYQLHNPSIKILQDTDIISTLLHLKKQGKIRFLGLSLHTTEEALWVLNNLPIDSLQVIYSVLDQRMRYEVFPLAMKKNVSILAREPLATGLLAGKYSKTTEFPKNDHRRRYSKVKLESDTLKVEKIKSLIQEHAVGASLTEIALKFVLYQPAVTCVIPGAKSVSQVSQNVVALEGTEREKDLMNQLANLFDQDPLFQRELLPTGGLTPTN